jgi:hypothetical protein
MLVCTSVREPRKSKNVTNNKMSSQLLSIAAKLSALRGCVSEGEAELAFDVMLKGLARRPLQIT